MLFRKFIVSIAEIDFDSSGSKYLEFLEECLIEMDPSKYFYVAQGMLTIDGIDDAEEMKLTDEAMDVLGFPKVRIDFHVDELNKKKGIFEITGG